MQQTEDLLSRLSSPRTREAAFTQIIRANQEKLYWQIRRMVGTHDDADDILQNTFMKAWMNLDSFRGESSIDTWLYIIATRETRSHLRGKRPQVSIDSPTDADDEECQPMQLEGDPFFDGDETQRQLQEAISTLPPKQREVFTLKYFQEMKYQDMSRILDTSIGALKASYHHAVDKITKYFESLD